jgi:hypothetical protein
MKSLKYSYKKSFDYIVNIKPTINPNYGFINQLKKLEE